MWNKGTCGSHSKKKKKNKKDEIKTKWVDELVARIQRVFFKFSSLNFFLRFTKTCPSEFVGINTESALRGEGYA